MLDFVLLGLSDHATATFMLVCSLDSNTHIRKWVRNFKAPKFDKIIENLAVVDWISTLINVQDS